MLAPVKQAILLIALSIAFRSIDAEGNDTAPAIIHRVERQSNSYVRGCYFTNWAQYRPGIGKFVPEDYIPGLCTNIFYAFGWMNDDFTVRAYDETDLPTSWAGEGNYARVNALKKTDPGLKTSLSFGGWTFGTEPFQRMARTTASRATFINSAIAFVRKYNFDGIDIDWEYPTGPQDKENFSAFLKEMLAAAEAEAAQSGLERLLLTAAVAAGESNINNGYDVPVIAQYLDFILLMSYDFHGAWQSQTGENSPLYARTDATTYQKTLSTNWAANYWASKGMPRNKIIVGIATYGRGWTLSNPSNTGLGAPGTASKPTPYLREAGIAAYYELCDMLSNGGQRFWDDEQKVPYLVQGNQWFGYDDVESVTIKMHYIIDEGFGGAFAWTLALDDFRGQCPDDNGVRYPLISLFGEILGSNVVPTVQPTPQTSTRTSPVTQPSTQPPVVTSTNQPGEFICTSDGFFTDPTDPTRFYRCVSGIAYPFSCPSGTIFNQEVESCVFGDSSKRSI